MLMTTLYKFFADIKEVISEVTSQVEKNSKGKNFKFKELKSGW